MDETGFNGSSIKFRFPAIVTMYLLIRIEGKLENLYVVFNSL
jgi:hypothetical protein